MLMELGLQENEKAVIRRDREDERLKNVK
jgi:hypothetical protein